MDNAETLFLVNDQKTQVFKFHILGKHPVGTDHNIHLSFFQITDGFLLLGRRAEAAEQIHPHRKLFHSLDKGIIYLLGQDSGGHKIYHLAAFLDFLKGGPKGHLRLSIAHISADKAVHDLRAFHIPLCILNSRKLILCLLIRKHFLELLLPYRIRTADVAFFFLADSVQLHQLLCDILDSTPDFCFRLFPFLTA